jgi:hypothetical protein
MQTQPWSISKKAQTANARPGMLTFGQLVGVSLIGILFWFAAAMTVRFAGPVGLFGPIASIVTFAVSIPICWLSVWLIKKLVQLGVGQTLPGVALGLVVATWLDGIGLTWGNGLYGTDPTVTTLGAAWILWGVGLFLIFAYREDLR